MKIVYFCNQWAFVRQEQSSHNANGISERDNISSRESRTRDIILNIITIIFNADLVQLSNFQLLALYFIIFTRTEQETCPWEDIHF